MVPPPEDESEDVDAEEEDSEDELLDLWVDDEPLPELRRMSLRESVR